MFIRTLDELERLGRIKSPLVNDTFRSARFLTAADGMGYSYNENRVKKGTDVIIWLKHHWEANYIVSGKGEVTDLTSDKRWPVEAGVLYVVGPNDRHRFLVTEDEWPTNRDRRLRRSDRCQDRADRIASAAAAAAELLRMGRSYGRVLVRRFTTSRLVALGFARF